MTEIVALGSVIRGMRKARKLSQEALAYESGVNRTFLSQIERGVRQPTVTTLYKLARTLNTSAADLLVSADVLLARQADKDRAVDGKGVTKSASLPPGFLEAVRPELFDFFTGGDYEGAVTYTEVKITEAFLLGVKEGRKKKS